MLKIYYADIGNLKPEEFSKQLSQYRIEKLNKIKPELNKRQSIGAELLLNFAVRENAPDAKLPLEILTDNLGKPYCPGLPFNFSLSHSEDMALCAISDSEIGADIQINKKPRENLIKRQFTPQEQELIMKASEPDRLFSEIWARKESCLKALGIGIRLPMNSFSVYPLNSTEIEGRVLRIWSGNIGAYSLALSTFGNKETEPELIEVKL